MKKYVLIILVLIGVLFLTISCQKENHQVRDEATSIAYQMVPSINFLQINKSQSLVKTTKEKNEDDNLPDTDIKNIEKYLEMMEELLADNGGFNIEMKDYDLTEYEKLLIVSTKNLKNETTVYQLYYNEITTKEHQSKKSTKNIKKIEGIAKTIDQEFLLEGTIKTEIEDDEEEIKSTFKIFEDEKNYVIVEEEIENEQNEEEHEYKYVVYNDGKKISETKFELEKEDGKTTIEIKEKDATTKTSYKFYLVDEKTKYFKIEIKNGSIVKKLKVRVIFDVETNTYTYDYKYIENNSNNF